MATTYEAIATVTVGSGGAANIEFTSIPGTYTDLLVKLSTRTNESQVFGAVTMDFNSSTSSQSTKYLFGNGASAGSLDPGAVLYVGDGVGANATASTFSNMEVYIPNYTSANNKSASADAVGETNGTTAYMSLQANLWSNTAAITSIRFNAITTKTFQQYSTATLYGIKNS